MYRFTRVPTFLIVLIASLLTLGSAAAGASAAVITKQVDASFRNMSGTRTAANGSVTCVYAIFVQWKHVPGAISATAKYRWRSGGAAATGGPFSDRETTLARDNAGRDYRFDNKWPGDHLFQAEPGLDWMQLPFNWATAGSAKCAEVEANTWRTVDGAPTLHLTLDVKKPRATALKGTQVLPTKTRRATVGNVTCPKHGECTVKVPKTVKVKIGGTKGTTYTLSVKAPKKLVAGDRAKKGNITVTFPQAAARALKGTKVRPSVKVTVRNHGKLPTTTTLKRWVRR